MFATNTDYNWHPLGLEHFGARIAGTLHVEVSGTYEFTLDTDSGSLLFIDGTVVVDEFTFYGRDKQGVPGGLSDLPSAYRQRQIDPGVAAVVAA